MSLIKTLCARCLKCLTNCFRSEEDQLHDKMIELQNRINSPQRDRSHRFHIKDSPRSSMQPQNIKKLAEHNREQPDNDFSFGQSPKNRFQIWQPHKTKIQESSERQQNSMGFFKGLNNTVSKKGSLNSQTDGHGLSPVSPNSPNNRNSNNSSDSFFTMQSGSLGSSNSISRRTFISLSKKSSEIRKGMLIKSKGSGDDDFKSIKNRDSILGPLPSLISADSKVQKYSEAMIEWNQKQYEKFADPSLRQNSQPRARAKYQQLQAVSELSTSQMHKLNSNSLLDELVNKLEDYYMFFQPEEMIKAAQNSQTPSKAVNVKPSEQTKQQILYSRLKRTNTHANKNSKGMESSSTNSSNSNHIYKYLPDKGYYINLVTNFKCSYQCQADSVYDHDYAVQAHLPVNFMKLVTFSCNTTNPLQFLYWFNSIEVRARLYDFNATLMIANGVYPTFYVEQYSGMLPQKNKYQMVRQIELVKFENEPDKEYIMQMDCSYGGGVGQENGRKFKSLLRFQIGESAVVEVYSESSEQIERGTHGDYFGEQWRNFEQKLSRDKMLKPIWKSSFNAPPGYPRN